MLNKLKNFAIESANIMFDDSKSDANMRLSPA